MGVREMLNNNPALGVLPAVVLIGAAGMLYWALRPESGQPVVLPPKAFFSTDDGATTFSDDFSRLAPFDKGGKQAVRAYVFKCPGQDEKINHLERFTPEGKKMLEAQRQTTGMPDVGAVRRANMAEREVKKPGEAAWVRGSELAKAGMIASPSKCPDGSVPEMVVAE